eukprot:c20392_g2_i3.p1 GENE.c20392_g2_i3~~c20392_g2_i3.p1  ORF type:complete len:583 (-),score=104.18 c20392_g2_i3:19-1740(-)
MRSMRVFVLLSFLGLTSARPRSASALVADDSDFEPSRRSQRIFPASREPCTNVFTISDNSLANANLVVTVMTLQGIVAQQKPQIWRTSGSDASLGHSIASTWIQARNERRLGRIQSPSEIETVTQAVNGSWSIWLDTLRDAGISVNTTFENNAPGLLAFFAPELTGYILCDSVPSPSVLVAAALAGPLRAIAVTTDNEGLATSLSLTKVLDVRGKNSQWLWDNYAHSFSQATVVTMLDSASMFNVLYDYSVMTQAVVIDGTEQGGNLAQRVVEDSMCNGPGTSVLGWNTSEYELVRATSQCGGGVACADLTHNLNVLASVNLESIAQKPSPGIQTQPGKHTVTFVFSDGDNIAWMLNEFATNPTWFGNPDRGKVSVGWTVSAAMADLAPSALKKFYEMASFFSLYPSRAAMTDHFAPTTQSLMQRGNMSIVNVMDLNPSFQSISDLMTDPAIEAAFYYAYAPYCGFNGQAWSFQGKPVISARFAFWTLDHNPYPCIIDTPERLADAINAASRDETSPNGYSVIPVHVWTHSYADVVATVKLLDPNVNVVAPDDFVALFKANVKNLPPMNPETK